MRACDVRRLNLIRRRAAAVGTHNGADLLFLIRLVDQQQQVIDDLAVALGRLQSAASRMARIQDDEPVPIRSSAPPTTAPPRICDAGSP